MLQKCVCIYCGKEFETDPSLGRWQKDGTQGFKKNSGFSSEVFCSYECGINSRNKKVSESWKKKSKEEVSAILEKRENLKKTVHCTTCGAEIELPSSVDKKERHFCSYKCRMIHKYNLPESGYRKCETCGKEYYYEQGQGNWTKTNEKLWSSGQQNGKGKIFTVPSHKYCCYECGIKAKEKARKESNIAKNGYASPFQNRELMTKIYEENIANGKQYVSKGEIEIKEFVESLGISTEKLVTGAGNSKDSPRFEIDIYIPDKKIGIEYNGSYYHAMNGKREGRIVRSYHYNKSLLAKEKGIQLIQIWEDQWVNQKDIIKDVLKARLGILSDNAIYARKCDVKEISNEDYKKFCEKNHVQGYHKASVKIGLYYNGELVQIASFSKCRNLGRTKKETYDYEWVRGCPASNNSVIGGTSKLFNYFVKQYNPESVLCYADWNLFNGQGYKQCGFVFNGYTGPDKFYVTPHSTKRINRSLSKYREYKKLVNEKKLFECYGAGSIRFIWRRNNESKTMVSVSERSETE